MQRADGGGRTTGPGRAGAHLQQLPQVSIRGGGGAAAAAQGGRHEHARAVPHAAADGAAVAVKAGAGGWRPQRGHQPLLFMLHCLGAGGGAGYDSRQAGGQGVAGSSVCKRQG